MGYSKALVIKVPSSGWQDPVFHSRSAQAATGCLCIPPGSDLLSFQPFPVSQIQRPGCQKGPILLKLVIKTNTGGNHEVKSILAGAQLGRAIQQIPAILDIYYPVDAANDLSVLVFLGQFFPVIFCVHQLMIFPVYQG
jgi:hypothetical protein